ncbi:MAG: PriCT-2 domain-containing protein [Bacteroidetes bacterium]|nr:PriCT-2 domain-containing protein [Bacteroidota bacterium]
MKKPHLDNGASITENNFPLEIQQDKGKDFPINAKPFVSIYETVTDSAPKQISIYEALSKVSSGELEKQILAIRECKIKEERDKLKRNLPSITVSGTFSKGHAKENITEHSGLIQIDFDSVENPAKTKEIFRNDVFTFATFISPSGTGVKVIVKVSPEKHSESFLLLKKFYAEKYGLKLDEKCKDVSRLMFLSHDKNIFVNPNSVLFDSVSRDVEKIILHIEKNKIDISPDYDNWLKIGFAFSSYFGETGKNFFHRISKFYTKYSFLDCEKQYNNCLREEKTAKTQEKRGVSIKSFFAIAKSFSINISSETKKTKPEEPETEKTEETTKGRNETKTKNETSKFFLVEKFISSRYEIRYNEVSNEVECKTKNETEYKALNENNLFRELQLNNIYFPQNNLLALLRSDFVSSYNPIKKYFDELPEWDNTTDHIKKLCSYITVKDQERFNRQFKKMLVRCIACALHGIFNKHAFILIGGQSSGKTTITRWLCPPKLKNYMAENISTDKDSLIALSENFFIVLDEIASLHKTEQTALKSVFTKDKIKIRRPFDRKPTVSIRRANFIGSTNKYEFLNDETGSVRWLSFVIEKIDFNYSQEINIDLVWAQAYTLFKSGFKYELTLDEVFENENSNSEHQQTSVEVDLIQKHFALQQKRATINI